MTRVSSRQMGGELPTTAEILSRPPLGRAVRLTTDQFEPRQKKKKLSCGGDRSLPTCQQGFKVLGIPFWPSGFHQQFLKREDRESPDPSLERETVSDHFVVCKVHVADEDVRPDPRSCLAANPGCN